MVFLFICTTCALQHVYFNELAITCIMYFVLDICTPSTMVYIHVHIDCGTVHHIHMSSMYVCVHMYVINYVCIQYMTCTHVVRSCFMYYMTYIHASHTYIHDIHTYIHTYVATYTYIYMCVVHVHTYLFIYMHTFYA